MIPANRTGYHIILAVWDVDDTANAFYNVMDVNVKNGQGPEIVIPDTPSHVKADQVTSSSVSLTWDADTKAKSYTIYRDGVKINTVETNYFVDKTVDANTVYHYQVEAVSYTSTVSEKSSELVVKTGIKENEIEKKTYCSFAFACNECNG